MIVQTTNKPIVLELDDDISDKPIRATLFDENGNLLAEWEHKDVIYHGNVIELPLLEEQTAKFPVGFANLEVKWLDYKNETEFVETIVMYVVERKDKTIFRGGSE